MTSPLALPVVALSIRQPWAWLIVNGHKDIENRDWLTNFRSPVLIHASKNIDPAEYESAREAVRQINPDLLASFPAHEKFERGGIVGVATISDCVPYSESPWFSGDFGFVMTDAKPLPFVPCRGALGFFKPDIPAGALTLG